MRRLTLVSILVCACSGGGSSAEPQPVDDGSSSEAAIDGAPAEDAQFGDATDAGCPDVDALVTCLATGGPDACARPCDVDSDGDGIGDRLELAIARTYAPAFAFNGGGAGGNAETDWPANAKHFVSHARLVYRDSSDHVVDAMPSLDSIADATYGGHPANDPASGEGSNFWLCLRDSTADTRVTSRAVMMALPDGIDLVSVVHPADGAGSSHLFVSYSLLFAYNEHSTVDNHEGDWEGIAVFVNRSTGAVDSAWFERHDTTDGTKFVSGATKDPAKESPYGDLDSGFGEVHGLRFFDAEKRHVVAYVATGSHAMYDYPANTYILKFGPRDTHDGDGPKLLSWSGQLVPSFSSTTGDGIAVHPWNAGEPSKITLPWARFRGQWGCDDGTIAKSWPGPFGNARHPRPLFERTWGSPPKP